LTCFIAYLQDTEFMPSAEAWRYIGLELPIRKVGSLCKVSELLREFFFEEMEK